MKELWPGWETVEPIGSGGFSKVYKIRKQDSGDERDYYSALKIISIPQSPDEYETYLGEGYDEDTITGIFTSQVKRIVEEFHLMSQFKGNSNIVSYEDHMIIPHENGKGWDIFIRMELLTSLTKHCTQNTLSTEETVKLGVGICRALELCQKKNIIHRDIKPQNIFVNEFGDYKLGDFGIAKSMDHTTHATKTGTYSYMAPEVYRGEAYGPTIDLYSLGLVLYWLLNERRMPFLPLPPAAPTANQLSEAQVRRLAGEALPAPKNGSERLKAIVLKACAPNAADRYASATAMRKALEKELFVLLDDEESEEASAPILPLGTTPNEVTVITADDEKTEGLFGAVPPPRPANNTVIESDDERTEVAPFAAFAAASAVSEEACETLQEKTVGLFGEANERTVAMKEPQPAPVAPAPKPAPTPTYPPAPPIQPKKSGAGKWIAIIGGAVLALIVVLLLLLRGCGGEDGDVILTDREETTTSVTDTPSVTPDPPVDELRYALNEDGTYRVIGIDVCEGSDLVIPATYNGKAVTEIENAAFEGSSLLKSVTIPASVTRIGPRAFAECANLERAIFENPTGWYVTKQSAIALASVTAEDEDAAVDLSDPVNAASYLTETYVEYAWYWTDEPPKTEEPVRIPVTLQLDPAGGTVNSTTLTVYFGEAYNNLPTPSRLGYSFAGWFIKDTDTQVTASSTVSTEAEHTLVARWKALEKSVQFNANGGSVSTDSKAITYGEAYGTLPTPTRTGYSFKGWFTAATGGQQVQASTLVTTTETHMLYARWEAKAFTVLLNANGGISSLPSITVTYDATYGTIPSPTRTGYTFAGWYTSATGGSKITSTTTVKIETSQTLYARWTANTYTVKFNANGGSGSMSAQTMTYGKSAALSKNGFTKSGCGFLGWSTSPNDLMARYKDAESVSNLANSGSVTLYAVWETLTLNQTELKLVMRPSQMTASHSSITLATIATNDYAKTAQVSVSVTGWHQPTGSMKAISSAGTTNITWTSSNTAIAKVSGGTVTALAEGTVTITATTPSGAKATCTVTVSKNFMMSWVVDKTSVATTDGFVTSTANVTAVARGTAILTAYAGTPEDFTYKVMITVKVLEAYKAIPLTSTSMYANFYRSAESSRGLFFYNTGYTTSFSFTFVTGSKAPTSGCLYQCYDSGSGIGCRIYFSSGKVVASQAYNGTWSTVTSSYTLEKNTLYTVTVSIAKGGASCTITVKGAGGTTLNTKTGTFTSKGASGGSYASIGPKASIKDGNAPNINLIAVNFSGTQGYYGYDQLQKYSFDCSSLSIGTTTIKSGNFTAAFSGTKVQYCYL